MMSNLKGSGTVVNTQRCPKCADNNMDTSEDNLIVYKHDDNSYSAHCFACGYDDQTFENMKVSTMKVKSERPLIPIGEYKAIKSRQISRDICKKFHYSWTHYKGELVQCASYYENDRIIAQKLRTRNKKFIWLGESKSVVKFFGQDNVNPHPKVQLVITEGELDCMAYSTLINGEWPVVSLVNGATSAVKFVEKNLLWLKQFKRIVFAFDMDETGQQAAEDCCRLFPIGYTCIAKLPANDICQAIQDGKADEVRKSILWASQYMPEDILSYSSFDEGELFEEDEAGYSTPYPIFNQMTNGLSPGRLYLLTAGSGIGKTTLCKEIGLHLLKHYDINIGHLFLEQNVKESLRDYIALANDINPSLYRHDFNLVSKDSIKEFMDRYSQRVFMLSHEFKSSDMDYFLGKIEYMIRACSCDFVIVDHVSMMISGLVTDNERKYIDILMTRLRELVHKTNKTLLVISHLKRPPNNFKTYTEGGSIRLTDLRGSGALEQLSDCVVALERDQMSSEHKNISNIKILKNRMTGEVGMADTLRFDNKTGHLLPEINFN